MKTTVMRGFTAGLFAAIVVAVWFLVVDVVKDQPLATPAYMSGLVFSFTTALPATARVLVFTLMHFLAFGIIGIVVAVLIGRSTLQARAYFGILLGLFLVGLIFYSWLLP
ncbi:MAG: hypothetical protein ACT4O1_14235 [Gemmatimonadota bacterium]